MLPPTAVGITHVVTPPGVVIEGAGAQGIAEGSVTFSTTLLPHAKFQCVEQRTGGW
jgi:hypothetical protein